MKKFDITKKNKIVRGAKRAEYDKDTVYDILDSGFLCHLAFNMGPQPFMIPTAYGRDGNALFVHGSFKSRTMLEAKKGIPICLAVTHLDGLVLARSVFHHSVNYRSAIIYGSATEITEPEEKDKALKCITENILKGRWDECRAPSKKELDITAVLRVEIESASAKIRNGGPVDEKADYDLDIWAGELPIVSRYEEPITDPLSKQKTQVSSAAVLAWEASKQ